MNLYIIDSIKFTSDISTLTLKIQELKLINVKEILFKEDFIAVVPPHVANFLTKILKIKIESTKNTVTYNKGDKIIYLQLYNKIPKTQILTSKDIKSILYKFYLISII